MKLNASAGLKKWLWEIDKLYFVDRNMEKYSNWRKEENQSNFEMMQKSLELEKKAKELKKKVNGSDKKK